MDRRRGAVDFTNQWAGQCVWHECLIETFRTYHQFMTWDVTPLGTFYHGLFRHLEHIGLERFITFVFCAGGRFAAASLIYKSPRDVKIRAQIAQATHLLKNVLQTEHVLQRKYWWDCVMQNFRVRIRNRIYVFCTNIYCMRKYRMFGLLRLCGKLSFLQDKSTRNQQ